MTQADLTPANDERAVPVADTTVLSSYNPDAVLMRSDAEEIRHRYELSSQRLRDLRGQKAVLFELIREEVITHNRLTRAARIYDIELEADSGD